MSGQCIVVRPLSRANIRHFAVSLREMCKLTAPLFPIVQFMDVTLVRDWEGYDFQVREMDELGTDAGRTFPDEKIVQIRQDVYDNARRGDGFGRFTLAHELGHLLLHRGIPFKRQVLKGQVPAYQDSEWQANQFAAELLMPVDAVRASGGPLALMGLCGVSEPAAEYRVGNLMKEGLL